jgi:hypothetical protein
MHKRTAITHLSWIALAATVLAVWTGCTSPENRNKNRAHYTELWLYEGLPGTNIDTNKAMAVMVANVPLVVRKSPFLTEEHLEEADIVDSPGGGFSMQLRFDDHGRYELDAFTGRHRGRNLVIFARYGVRKTEDKIPLKEAWLGAPLINRQINDGVIIFTPSGNKEELYSILDGLRNAIKVQHKPWVF